MGKDILQGFTVGLCAITIATAIFYPLKIKAKKKSFEALFHIFTVGAIIRLLFLVGIIVWGFKFSPLSGFVAIFSFGVFFLLYSLIEVFFLKPIPHGRSA